MQPPTGVVKRYSKLLLVIIGIALIYWSSVMYFNPTTLTALPWTSFKVANDTYVTKNDVRPDMRQNDTRKDFRTDAARPHDVIQDFRKNDTRSDISKNNVRPDVAKKDLRTDADVGTNTTRNDVRQNDVKVKSDLPLCPEKPTITENKVDLKLNNITYEELKKEFSGILEPGGHYAPRDCKSRERIAIIIPYRDRQRNLFILLRNLIPFLMRQQAEFKIFLIEQVPGSLFNKGVLIDVGFLKSREEGGFTCFIVHDTDLIPWDNRNLYRCDAKRPRHLMLIRSGERRKKPEVLPYHSFIGGAIALTKEQFEKSNGWSTSYYGWGFEDDDMEIRLKSHGFPVTRYAKEIGKYYELGHNQWKAGPRSKLAKTVRTRMNAEGINTVKYTLVDHKVLEMYSWYLIKPPPAPKDIYGNSTR